jgi:hypothetical protein
VELREEINVWGHGMGSTDMAGFGDGLQYTSTVKKLSIS